MGLSQYSWLIFATALCAFENVLAQYGASASCGCSNSSIHQIIPVPASLAAPLNPLRPFQRIVRAGDSVYLTGVTGVDPLTNVVVSNDTQSQAVKAMQNLRVGLSLVGCDLGDIYMLTVLIVDSTSITPADAGIAQAFAEANQPVQFAALKFVTVGIYQPGAVVEIAAIANGCKWPN